MGGHIVHRNDHSQPHLPHSHDSLQHQQQQQQSWLPNAAEANSGPWLSSRAQPNVSVGMQAFSQGSNQTGSTPEHHSAGKYVQHCSATVNLPLPAGPHSSSAGTPAALQTSSSPTGPSASSSHTTSSIKWQKAKASISAFVLNNFMLLSFSLAAALAMAWPLPGRVVASWSIGDVRVVQAVNNFLVFLISGLTLKSDDFR
jgi:hypothetical protein